MTRGAAPQLVAECAGSALLLATVVGSGIMGERLCGGNVALALLANTLATGAVLYALITAFAPVSGAHFNPAVTLAEALSGKLPWRRAGLYIVVQFGGAVIGVAVAHWMFDLGAFAASRHVRAGTAQALSEVVATFGLLTIILNCARYRPQATAAAVGAYIAAAYWFTASTSFANPAVTLARTLTDTFSGIRPVDAPLFMAAQIAGALLALVLHRWMSATRPA